MKSTVFHLIGLGERCPFCCGSDVVRGPAASQIVLFGKSLGGAVVIHLAAQQPDRVRALIVENTFTSLENLAPVVRSCPAPLQFTNTCVCHPVCTLACECNKRFARETCASTLADAYV